MLADARDSLTQQLEDLYAERDFLHQEIGISDAEGIVSMVRNLEAQLRDFYSTYGGVNDTGHGSTDLLLSQVEKMSEQLDAFYNHKEIILTIENDKPVVKATWKKSNFATAN